MRKTSYLTRALLVVTALSGGACVSLEQAAPLPKTLPAAMRVGTPSQLALGREIYVTKCAACHSVEPVRKYSLAQWEHDILPEMAEETNLNEHDTAAVRAYVVSVLKSPVTEG